MRSTIGTLCLITVLTALANDTPGPYQLAVRPKVKAATSYRVTIAMREAGGQVIVRGQAYDEVISVLPSGNYRTKRVLRNCTVEMEKQTIRIDDTGETILTMKPTGEVVGVDRARPNSAEILLPQLVQVIFPADPVSTGSQWTAIANLPAASDAKLQVKFAAQKLVDAGTKKGIEVAVEGALSSQPEASVKGTACIDVANSAILRRHFQISRLRIGSGTPMDIEYSEEWLSSSGTN